MILGKTQKIMKTGISKYSKELEITKESTQILVTSDEADGVDYTICGSWKPNFKVSFKDIMDVRVDLLGFEMMASPFLRKSVDMYANYYDTLPKEINLFIFEKNDKVGVAVYDKTEFKEAISLEKQFERLGI
tara:strand:- start:25 stop:420 length:396 start_codon:yes stop_codon:yes gene_type:complete